MRHLLKIQPTLSYFFAIDACGYKDFSNLMYVHWLTLREQCPRRPRTKMTGGDPVTVSKQRSKLTPTSSPRPSPQQPMLTETRGKTMHTHHMSPFSHIPITENHNPQPSSCHELPAIAANVVKGMQTANDTITNNDPEKATATTTARAN